MLLEDAVREYIYEIQCRNYTKRTIKGYKNNLLKFTKHLTVEQQIEELEEIRPQHIKEYLNQLKARGLSTTYINTILKNIRSFYKYCYQEGYSGNVASKIGWLKEEKPLIKSFSDEQIKKMLNYYKGNSFREIRNKAIISMLVDTGLRNSELCALRIGDVRETVVFVRGKGRKERIVPISPQLKKLLIKYERVREGYLKDNILHYDNYFLSYRCRPLTVEGIERIVKICGEGIKGIRVSPHTIRHYYAQAQLRNGLDVYSLSRLLGHSTIDITKIYLQSIQDESIIELSRKRSPLSNIK